MFSNRMRHFLPALSLLLLALSTGLRCNAQELTSDVDLLYPEFAHPKKDALKAIKEGDYRFITVDRQRRIVPGVEHYPSLRQKYHTKYLRQPLRLFPTKSENFSFNLRAHAYAREYNQTLIAFLLRRERENRQSETKHH